MDLRLTGVLVVALATLSASGKVIPTECPKHDLTNHTVHLAHESDCTKFYKCDDGKKIVFDCPVYNEEGDKLYFNVTLQYCDWPENVDCKLPQPIVAIPSRAGVPSKCPKSNSPNLPVVHLAHESDCTKFYKCKNGEKVVFDCPVYNEDGDRLYFDPNLQVCDWPEKVVCKLPQPIVAIPSRAGVPSKCPKRNLPNLPVVHLAHENDCTKFYKCDWGKKVPFDCPIYNEENDRLYFNPNLQICDWPENVDCKLPFPNNDCIGLCPNINTYPYSALLPHRDCTKFCICSRGVAYVHYCSGKFPYWNHNKRRCSKAEEADCSIVKSLPKF